MAQLTLWENYYALYVTTLILVADTYKTKPMTATTITANKPKILVGLFITLIAFISCLVIPKLISACANLNLANSVTFLLSRLLMWCLLLLMCWYAIKVEKQPLFMWKEKSYPISFYLISLVLVVLCVVIGDVLIALLVRFLKLHSHSTALAKLISLSLPLKLCGVITAAVVEEFVFRAYLIPRLQLYLKYGWLAVLVSAIIFGLIHFGYGTLLNILAPVFCGLIFGFHYYKYRNIKVLILCHALIDFYAVIIQHQHSR